MRLRPAARALPAAALLFLAAAALVVAVTWPWAAHWRGAFLDHWDPPFHAWKLEFMARRILAGDVLLASGDTNLLYPHTGTLYYEALQYPPALFAALLFGLTPLPSELVYHVTLLVFWALSAPCMYFLLRTLACARAAASFGALAFCVAPWRVSYAPEFQMELVFAIPLVFAFLVRFLRDRRAADAALCALSWWLLAVSELYEAVFVAMAVPLVAAALLGREPGMLREKRFWRGALAAGAAGLASLLVLVGPYLTQRGEGAVLRPLKETAMHAAQPFSYLLPWGPATPWSLDAKFDELSLYPTLAILLLCLGGAMWRTTSLRRAAADAPGGALRRRLPLLAHLGAIWAAVLFLVVCLAFQSGAIPPPSRWGLRAWRAAACLLAAASFAVPFAPPRGESHRAAFLRGMLATAGFFFLLSLGPMISLGHDLNHVVAAAENPVYLLCHNRLLPFLSAFRVVSRFGAIVVFAAICAAAVALDRALAAPPLRRRAWAAPMLAALLVAAVSAEAVPFDKRIAHYAPIVDQRASPAIARLVAAHPIRTIAAIPMGPRRLEGDRMFTLIKGDFPAVYAWGGFFPDWSQKVQALATRFDVQGFRHELAKLFPEALLVVDAACSIRTDVAPGLPPGAILRETEPGRLASLDWEKAYADIAALRDRDGRFLLFDLKPEPPAPAVEKIFRSDVARLNPVVRAEIDAAPGARIAALLNGVPAASGLERGAMVFELPPRQLRQLSKAAPNSLVFRAEDGSPVAGRAFRMEGRGGTYHDPCAPYSTAPLPHHATTTP